MNALKLIVLLTLAASAAAAVAAPGYGAARTEEPMPAATWSQRWHAGATWVVRDETAKHQLDERGFPQYTE